MPRSAPRLSRVLACAAVPVMLVAAGCSSGSDSGKDKAPGSPDKAASSAPAEAPPATPTKKAVEPAKFAKLPEVCKAVSSKTIDELVPKAKTKKGTAAASSDLDSRGGCSWNGLEDKGTKGSNYRWLDVSFYRYESDATLGSGQERAAANYTKELGKAQQTEGAKGAKTSEASGVGEKAETVTYQLHKTDEDFQYASVVARTGNVVVLVTYNGAGYAGSKTPSEKWITEGAVKTAKEAVTAIEAANK
ncbi:DUF3558 domain-containing protein [Streptomyces sp. NPDC046203]|uniref:DUF3558 domain-containing protein n=1 Tax=Streptomyces sp. NPDC046203 TaxID=3154602 RepID=UPI0033D0E80E